MIAGSSAAMESLLPGLIEDFGHKNGHLVTRQDIGKGWTYFVSDPSRVPVARIQARSGDNGSAFRSLAADRADIAVATRPPNQTERAGVRRAGLGEPLERGRSQIIAIDALTFIVSPENPVKSLSIADVAAVFSGKVTNWQDLGGIDAPINVYRPSVTDDVALDFFARWRNRGR